jgi:hypothetical protein
MKRLIVLAAFALLSGPLAAEEKTVRHGTAVNFVGSPREASKLAAQQKKLVCILHVSGHFEDPAFT